MADSHDCVNGLLYRGCTAMNTEEPGRLLTCHNKDGGADDTRTGIRIEDEQRPAYSVPASSRTDPHDLFSAGSRRARLDEGGCTSRSSEVFPHGPKEDDHLRPPGALECCQSPCSAGPDDYHLAPKWRRAQLDQNRLLSQQQATSDFCLSVQVLRDAVADGALTVGRPRRGTWEAGLTGACFRETLTGVHLATVVLVGFTVLSPG